jgi:K+/H+ antiporter YhaU regulatory subunit KhtT
VLRKEVAVMRHDSDSIAETISALQLEAEQTAHLLGLIDRRLAQQESEIRDGMERALGLVPRLLRGAVRKLLAL